MGSSWHGEGPFESLESVFALQGEPITTCPISEVIRITIDNRRYYVKRYTGSGKGTRRYFQRSRVRGEWENLQFFASLGIPTPRIMAYGQERILFHFKRGALITEEIPNTFDLATLLHSQDPILKNTHWCNQVIEQIAAHARKLHSIRFIHGDFYARNLLVDKSENPKVWFIDCPIGQKFPIPLFPYWQIKDLACLSKGIAPFMTQKQKLHFLHHYLDQPKLDASAHRLIARYEHYLARKRA